MFIVLEGIDGTGKTTIANMLAQYFSYTHLELTHPSIRPFMDSILGKVEPNVFHAFNMANLMNTSSLVNREIAAGVPVVCARYFPTVIAYHRVMSWRKKVSKIFDPSVELFHITKPDLAFHLTVNEPLRQQRMNNRGRTTNSDSMMDNKGIRDAILRQYNNMDMIEIDTSYVEPAEIVQKIIGYIALHQK